MRVVTINGLDITVSDGPVGILMSGGADSSLLFYILMKYVDGPINVYSCGNGLTNYREITNAKRIVDHVVELTGKTDVNFFEHSTPHKTRDTILSDVCKHSDDKVVYIGLTRPPPEGAIVDVDIQNSAALGGVDHYKEIPNFWSNVYYPPESIFGVQPRLARPKSFCLPFSNVNKKFLAEMYKELEIENLYSLTRSCESLTINDRHCGTCWWCKERVWGFGKLV